MKRNLSWVGVASCLLLAYVLLLWNPSKMIHAQSGHSITLTWTASAGATSYNVKRSTSSGTEANLATGIVPTTYVDASGVAGTKYFYVVTAVNQFGESASSNEVSATFLGNPPPAPAGLAAVSN